MGNSVSKIYCKYKVVADLFLGMLPLIIVVVFLIKRKRKDLLLVSEIPSDFTKSH
jgi:hypothetical protein